MGMGNVFPAKTDDFLITTDRRSLVLTAILAKETLHQPRLGQLGRNIENSVEKYLCYFPTLFGNGTRSVSPVDADDRVFWLALQWALRGGSLMFG